MPLPLMTLEMAGGPAPPKPGGPAPAGRKVENAVIHVGVAAVARVVAPPDGRPRDWARIDDLRRDDPRICHDLASRGAVECGQCRGARCRVAPFWLGGCRSPAW